MKRLAIIILTSTILLTGCSSNDKIAMLENAVKSSKDLIAKEEFEQAKGLLVYVSQNGGSKIDGYYKRCSGLGSKNKRKNRK